MIHLEVGDRICFFKPPGYRRRFPFRRRHTQAWNRERSRFPLRDESRAQRAKGFYVVSQVTETSSITLV